MEITEDGIFEKHAKQCMHCTRNTILPYEYEFSCNACGYNNIKRKNALTKLQPKQKNFINRLIKNIMKRRIFVYV